MQDTQYTPEHARVIKDINFHLRTTEHKPLTIDEVAEQLSVYLAASKGSDGLAYDSGVDVALSVLVDATASAQHGTDVVTWLHNTRSVLRYHQGPAIGQRRRAIDHAIKATNQAIYAVTRTSRH